MFSQGYEAEVILHNGWRAQVKEAFWKKKNSYLTAILVVKIKERENIYSVSGTS